MKKEKLNLELIVALAKNNVIGKDNSLIWDIKEDMKHFVSVTKNKTVIMGSKTYDSLKGPLKNRKNVVLTRDPSKYEGHDVVCISSLEEGLEIAKRENAIIIGGENVYKQFLPYCTILHITEIEEEFEGDTFFPKLDINWEKAFSLVGKESGVKCENNPEGLKYTFNLYMQ